MDSIRYITTEHFACDDAVQQKCMLQKLLEEYAQSVLRQLLHGANL